MGFEIEIKKNMGDFKLNVSFAGEDGVTAILGASGCGKSMTLRCIAGIETPDQGRITVNGRVLFDSKQKINLPPQKRNVGYMFQDYALFPNMTVRENIQIAAGKEMPEEEFYERFQLTEILNHYPSMLSGGQKQRTAMARMLAAKPEMILLDEPFSALDSFLKWQMEQEVKKILEREEKPTILVSHDRDEVYRNSRYVGIMSEGKMQGLENTKELFRRPGTRLAAILSGCKNLAEAERIDNLHIFVPRWGIQLESKEEVTFEKGFVGIRAHSFEAADPGLGKKNCLHIEQAELTEEPFEWNLTFHPTASSEGMQWKISKEMWGDMNERMPDRLWIRPENLLLLEE